MVTCSGAESDGKTLLSYLVVYQCALLSDSSAESDCNTSDVSEKQNCNGVVNEGISNKEDISEKSNGTTSDRRIEDNLSKNEFSKHMHVHNF